MNDIPFNLLAVLGAAVTSMVLGFLWYGPLFGKQWMALSGLNAEKLESLKKRGMGKYYALQFLGSLVMSFVLAHALFFASSTLAVDGVSAGLMAGFWNWLGFVAPVTIGTVMWEGKSWRLWALTNGYYLITLLCMGVILSLWQ